MKFRINLLKPLSVILAVLIAVVCLPILLSSADENPVAPFGLQNFLDSSNKTISYTGFDWSSLGKNLIPDPTVANFVEDANGDLVYGRYCKITADYKPAAINTRYWWDKYIDEEQGFTKYYKNKVRDEGAVTLSGPDENGNYTIPAGSLANVAKQGGQYKCDGVVYNPMLRSPANRDPGVRTIDSLTNDGSGSLYTKSAGGWRGMPLPSMEQNSYYVIKFNTKASILEGTIINFGIRLTPPTSLDESQNDFVVSFYEGIHKKSNTEGGYASYFSNQKVITMAFLVYTGSNSYSDPCIDFYMNTEMWFDDFGMYKVSEDYAAGCADGQKLEEQEIVLSNTPQIAQTVFNKENGLKNDYSKYNWEFYGANYVTDPTVSNFVGDGNGGKVYGDYAVPVKQTDGSYNHETVNDTYWWDKYVEFKNGFNYYWQKTLDGVTPAGYNEAYCSPKQRNEVVSDSSLSLTNDGSGVIRATSSDGARKLYALPEMKPLNYYLVKFNIKFSAVNESSDFDFYNGDSLLASDLLDMSGFGTEKDTVTLIVYTGDNNYSNPYISFWLDAGNTVYLDDFGVYTLSYDYANLCIAEQRLALLSFVDTAPLASATPNVEGYDFNSAGNTFEDGSFETDAAAVSDSAAKFGTKVLKVDSSKDISFTTQTGKYYLVSFWSKGTVGDQFSVSIRQNDSDASIGIYNINASDTWQQSTFILYSSYGIDYVLKVAAKNAVYIDGMSVIELPQTVSLACYAMDSYPDGTFDPDRVSTAAEVFGLDNEFSSLISPIYSSGAITYKQLYNKYLNLIRVEKGFAPSGYGSRENPKQITTLDENNLIKNGSCDDESYWKSADTVGSKFIEITDEYAVEGKAIKFTGKKANGDVAIYKKRFTGLMPNTVYYLRLQGMGLGDVISDADFGFMDTEYGKELQNPLNEARATTAAYRATFKQRNNFQCQDGSWYTRVYEFNTENNTELDFFIRGTRGTVYYDNIKLFKQSDAYTLSSDGKVQPMAVLEYSEENFACKVKDNLIENWDFSKGTKFWENFKGFGNFVEVATSEDNNMLHFKGNDLAYYYLPWVDVKANVTYTFSFWKKNLNGESSRSVLVSEYNPHGYASEIYSVAEKYGEWELISVKFVCHENNRVALGVYDRDGEAVFDNVRFFESSKGYAVSKAKDMPVGGDKFSYTLLGSDGVTVVDKPSVADDSADDYDDEFIDDILIVDEEELPEEDTIQEVVTKRRKKVFLAGSGIPTWGIVLIGVGALAVLTGGVFLFLFLKKKKKRKE